MDCTSCAFNIDGELEDLTGVKEAATNYAKQVTEILFDPTQITLDEMIAVIKKLDNAYEVEVIA